MRSNYLPVRNWKLDEACGLARTHTQVHFMPSIMNQYFALCWFHLYTTNPTKCFKSSWFRSSRGSHFLGVSFSHGLFAWAGGGGIPTAQITPNHVASYKDDIGGVSVFTHDLDHGWQISTSRSHTHSAAIGDRTKSSTLPKKRNLWSFFPDHPLPPPGGGTHYIW